LGSGRIDVRALAALALLWSASALATPVPADEVRTALASTARSVAEVALDADGRARGDYVWKKGIWSEYEALWHTGQAIEALLAAYAVTGDPKLLKSARTAGDWWISQEFKSGPLKGMVNAAHGDRLGRLINFTTVSNGSQGLFSLSRATGDLKYADTATRAIIWLARKTKVPGDQGLYYNMIDPDSGAIWTDKSPHHPDVAKASVNQVARPNIEGSPFLDACRHARQKWLCDAHFDLAAKTTARQSANGFWMEFEPNNPGDGTVHPRFNTWNAEAMLRTYRETKEARYLDAALATARANARMMKADGSFDYEQNVSGNSGSRSPTGSASAFAGLLWLDLRALGHREFDDKIHAAARWLIANRFPDDHADPNVRGMVFEFRHKGTSILHRDLGSIFATRFLAAYLNAFPNKAQK
jgi:Beta-L-arabinofuranosidase, GH127